MGSVEQRLMCLDQLAAARDELKYEDSTHGRLGHILTDNAVELMLHFQAEAVLSNEWRYSEIIPKNKKRNAEALGRKFAPKVKFARNIGTLTALEADYILINHEYRNQLYHLGLANEEVVQILAAGYHAFACSLIGRFKFWLTSFSSDLKVPERLKPYWITSREVLPDYEAQLFSIGQALAKE